MKICQYHLDDLKTQLLRQGITPGDGPKAPIHSAHSALLALCLAEGGRTVVESPLCPVCMLMRPSLVQRAAAGIAASIREGDLPQHLGHH